MSICCENLLWNKTHEEILNTAKTLMQETKADYDLLVAIPNTDINFCNTLKKINELDHKFSSSRDILGFYYFVHPEKSVREASDIASKLLANFDISCHVKQEIFNRASKIQRQNNSTLSDEDKQFLSRVNNYGKQNGLHLSQQIQNKIKRLDQRIAEICVKFQENLREELLYLSVAIGDLEGLPKEFIDSLEKEDSHHYKLFLNYHHYFFIMSLCVRAYTRKAMEVAFHKHCKLENVALIIELINLRHRRAKLLGFDSHASYVVNSCMAKYVEEVERFLLTLTERLMPLGKKMLRSMLLLKRADCEEEEHSFDGKINMWDIRYYGAKLTSSTLPIDKEELRKFFPVNVVVGGLFKLTEDLFRLKFERVSNASVWHDDVTMYSVTDINKEVVIGYVYIDLLHRPEKYPHVASFCLVPGCLNEDGVRQKAVTALIGNFLKLPDGREPNLFHDEVQMLFYEFGQILQYLCSEAKYEAFSRSSAEKDFLSIPSIILENLCWEIEPLQRISRHCEDGSILSIESIELLAKFRNSNSAIFYLKQIVLASLDMTLHTNPSIDIGQEYAELCKRILGVPASKNTLMPASFVHLVKGYDALYYSYLWSKVYSFDMYQTRFKREGLMNPEVAQEFREKILAPGGSVDARRKFLDFVGREPCTKAFVENLELSDQDVIANLYYQPISNLTLSDSLIEISSSQFLNNSRFTPRRSASEILEQNPRHLTPVHKVHSYQSVFSQQTSNTRNQLTTSENDEMTEF